jgi:hypothetical protein
LRKDFSFWNQWLLAAFNQQFKSTVQDSLSSAFSKYLLEMEKRSQEVFRADHPGTLINL